ncbi:MAG: hypothetical protein L3K26_01545 [Candidatus Hydrogenedentes bacterium]|nr:hypothetical protein [Candidatus Hydrogenedentota bacterium]
MCRILHRIPAIPLLLLGLLASSIAVSAQTPPAPDDPALVALLDARASAESLIAQGDLQGAAGVLVQSLRDVPPTRSELADATYGNGQLASFLFLHVMREADAYAYLEGQIDPDAYPTDRMLKLLCYIAVGLAKEDKEHFTREITYLTETDHKVVRAIVLYNLSMPYFYRNDAFNEQYRKMLAADYPDLELTQVSLNLPLYEDKDTDMPTSAVSAAAASAVAKGSGQPSEPRPYKPWSVSLRDRIRNSANVSKAAETGAGPDPLLDGVTQAQDWRERHFSLLLLKGAAGELRGENMRAAARALAHRTDGTPDVVQARIYMVSRARGDLVADGADQRARAECVLWARTLLDTAIEVTTPERVLWGARMRAIKGAAESLEAAGHVEEAADTCAALAEQFPNSKIADACEARLSILRP